MNFENLSYKSWPLVLQFESLRSSNQFINGCDGMIVRPDRFDVRIYRHAYQDLCPSRSDVWIGASLLANYTEAFKISKSTILTEGDKFHLTKFGDFPKSKVSNNYELHKSDLERNDKMIEDTFRYFNLLR